MCNDTYKNVLMRECQMCKQRLLARSVRTLCVWEYRVRYEDTVFEYRAFNINVCYECWFIHSVSIEGGFWECVKEVNYV